MSVINDNIIEVCVGLNSTGGVVKVFNTADEMRKDMENDTTPEIISGGIVTTIVSDYDEWLSKKLPKYEFCDCCEEYHRVEYDGDCRNDEARFSAQDLDELHGFNGWEDVTEDEN